MPPSFLGPDAQKPSKDVGLLMHINTGSPAQHYVECIVLDRWSLDLFFRREAKKMKRTVLVIAAALVTAAPSLWAQTDSFTGLQLGANLRFVSTSAEVHNGSFSGSIGDTDTSGSLQAGYGFKLDGRGRLGLGLAYGPGSVKGGSHGITAFTSKDMYSVHIEPGYALGNESLLYVKIAYLGMRGDASTPSSTGSENFRGIGYGAGTRILLSKNLYLQIEVVQAEYNELRVNGATYNPSSTTGSIGLGYLFWK